MVAACRDFIRRKSAQLKHRPRHGTPVSGVPVPRNLEVDSRTLDYYNAFDAVRARLVRAHSTLAGLSRRNA
jgi:hypothetical protein